MSIKKGRVALVTGAGSGLGRAIAQGLGAEGAYVVCQDFNPVTAKETADMIIAEGGVADSVQGDVSNSADCDRFVQFCVERFGGLDILVNNAGIIRDALVHKMTDEQWQKVIDVNLSGVFYCSRAAVQVMKEANRNRPENERYGRVINMSSIGYIGYRGQVNYGATKAGVIAMTRTMTAEYTWCGITFNAICPGTIKTPMSMNCMGGGDNWLNYVKKVHPMGHPGEPSDIAYMACALCAEEAGFITGQTIAVDGGLGRVRL